MAVANAPPDPAGGKPGAGGTYRDLAARLQPAQHRRGAEPGVEPAGTRPAPPPGGRLPAQPAAARNHGTPAVPYDRGRFRAADTHSYKWRVLLRGAVRQAAAFHPPHRAVDYRLGDIRHAARRPPPVRLARTHGGGLDAGRLPVAGAR